MHRSYKLAAKSDWLEMAPRCGGCLGALLAAVLGIVTFVLGPKVN